MCAHAVAMLGKRVRRDTHALFRGKRNRGRCPKFCCAYTCASSPNRRGPTLSTSRIPERVQFMYYFKYGRRVRNRFNGCEFAPPFPSANMSAVWCASCALSYIEFRAGARCGTLQMRHHHVRLGTRRRRRNVISAPHFVHVLLQPDSIPQESTSLLHVCGTEIRYG